MDQKLPTDMLTAHECAAHTGLSVRALRLYERHGLISPHRTAKNWRLYSAKDLERLSEIIILKGFGLPLSRIAKLLAGKETNLKGVLSMQSDALTQQRSRIDQSLATIASVQSEMSVGVVSVSTLINLAKEMTMTDATTDDLAWRLYEQARPRTEISLDASTLDDYPSHYRLEDGTVVTIEPGKNSIEISLTGQPFIPLYPEARDKFFSKQMPLQFTFDRNTTGSITGLTLHQSGLELPAKRMSAGEAEKLMTALAKRVSEKTAFPSSEATLRKMISNAQEGVMDETQMTAEMAKVVEPQVKTVKREMRDLGALRSLTFKGVGRDGWDVYDANFENGEQQWRIYLQDDGKVSGLLVRPSP
jgi:DNA-binding transcriptional MerR regulator